MSARIKWYVGAVGLAGLVTVVLLVPRVDLDRVRQAPGAVALFAVLLFAGQLVPIRIPRRREIKELDISTTFGFALIPLAGVSVAGLVCAGSSLAADLLRRKEPVKLLFNASQYVVALAAGGIVYTTLASGSTVDTAALPALAAGAVVFAFLNHFLVSTVLSLARGTPLRAELVRDLRVELASSTMLLALAPVAVVVAERSLPLVPALVLPIGAVYLASKGQVEAEVAAERQRSLTEQEQEVVRRLQEADRLKADLIATVSHELRSPLTTILGVFGILRTRSRRLGPGERDDLTLMGIRQSERLQRMIDQLLMAAGFQREGRGVAPWAVRTELDAAELVRQAGAEARARHVGRPIAIETNGALPVRVAQDAVVQVLGNLIDNACKYSPDGEPIRLYGIRSGAQAVLAVEDAGPGIPSADRQRIFDRFTQLDGHSHQRAGGVGLGLYIARQLARGQDGELVVAEASGEGGARFELRLPIRDATGS
jgi:signal transduction histidine kinase